MLSSGLSEVQKIDQAGHFLVSIAARGLIPSVCVKCIWSQVPWAQRLCLPLAECLVSHACPQGQDTKDRVSVPGRQPQSPPYPGWSLGVGLSMVGFLLALHLLTDLMQSKLAAFCPRPLESPGKASRAPAGISS